MKHFRFLAAILMVIAWGQMAWADSLATDGLIYYTDDAGITYECDANTAMALIVDIPNTRTTIVPLENLTASDGYIYYVRGFSAQLLSTAYEGHTTTSDNWQKVILPPNFTINLSFLSGCKSLESVEFSSESLMVELPGGCLRDNPKLSHVVLPPLLSSISRGCFYNCSSLTTITLPDAVLTIEENAFANSGLTTLNTNKVTTVGDAAFMNTSLESIQMPEVTTIGVSAFNGSTIGSIQIPKVTKIDDYAFEGLANSTFEIPSQVTEIGEHAFANSKLTVLNAPYLVSIGRSAFSNSQELTTINIPKVETIADEAFESCISLTGFNWNPKVLQSIGKRAFAGVLPNEDPVTLSFSNPDLLIGSEAFYTSVTYPSREIIIDCLTPAVEGYTMPMNSTAFNDAQKKYIVVNVPAGTGNRYREMYGWQGFKIAEDLSGVTLSEYEEVNGNFGTWFGQYTASQLSAVKRLKVKGTLSEDDWAELRQMCDGTVSGVGLRTLDLSEAQLAGSEEQTFSGFSTLDTLYQPKSGRYLATGCLSGCKSNLVVIVPDQTPPSALDEYFAGAVAGMTLIVPSGTYSKYSARQGWCLFGNIQVENVVSETPWVSFAFRSLEAGSLAAALQRMSDKEQHMLAGLTVSGPLNSADLKEIRRLCGAPFVLGGAATGYNVSFLDLADATFVVDATPFCNNGNYDCNIAKANTIPSYAFCGMTQVDTLWLPSAPRTLNASVFKQANATMKVFALWNDPTQLVVYEGTFATDVAQMTLVVPAGRQTTYQNAMPSYSFSKFGNIVAGSFEGLGAVPAEAPDNLTLNICRGAAGAQVGIQYYASNRLKTVFVSNPATTTSIPRSDVANGGNPYLHLLIYTTREVSVYLDGNDITSRAVTTVREDKHDTCYDFDYYALGFDNGNTYEADVVIQFADAVVTDVRTVRLTSNTLDQEGIVFTMYDKKDDGTADYDTAAPLPINAFRSIPATKVIQMYLPLSNNNPWESGVLTLNGVEVQQASPGYESSNCQYEVTDLSPLQVWDFKLTVRRDGDPNPDYITHNINFIDASGQASMSYSYNTSAGEAETMSVSEGINTFQLPNVTYDENTCFVDMAVKVPTGYLLTVSKADTNIDWRLTRDDQTTVEDGVEYDVYHVHDNSYEYRMSNQAFVVMVKEPDAVREWNVVLTGEATAVFSLQQANGSSLGEDYVWESRTMAVSEKAASVSLAVGSRSQDPEFWTTHDLVVIADGQDLSSLFTTEPAWVGNTYGVVTTQPLTGDILNATNWIIGAKAKDSNMATWTMQTKDEVPAGAEAEVSLATMQLSVGADNDFDSNSYSDADPLTAQKSARVVVPAGYVFKLWFNGTDYTSRLSLSSTDAQGRKVYTADFADADELGVDGSWVVLFMDKNKNYDVNGDGQVTIADVTEVVSVILGQ